MDAVILSEAKKLVFGRFLAKARRKDENKKAFGSGDSCLKTFGNLQVAANSKLILPRYSTRLIYITYRSNFRCKIILLMQKDRASNF